MHQIWHEMSFHANCNKEEASQTSWVSTYAALIPQSLPLLNARQLQVHRTARGKDFGFGGFARRQVIGKATCH